MVAVSEDRDAALLMGINTNRIIAITFAPLLLVTEAWFSAGHSETQNKIYFPVSLSLVLAYDIYAEVIYGKAA